MRVAALLTTSMWSNKLSRVARGKGILIDASWYMGLVGESLNLAAGSIPVSVMEICFCRTFRFCSCLDSYTRQILQDCRCRFASIVLHII